MQQTNNAAKFAFFYMLSLVALIFLSISSGMIIFQIINKQITDLVNQFGGQYAPDQLKFAISALIIAAPIYFITMRQLHKNLYSGALAKDSGVRKWLTYFIIFVSSIVMLGWLIATINNFLDGELTTKFILKAMTAIAIAAASFTFYLYDIRREETAGKKDKVVRIYFYGSLAAVAVVFSAALFFVESPGQTRDRKLDNAILEKFDRLDSAIYTYYLDEEKLPDRLDQLINEFSFISQTDLVDPASQKKFEYKIVAPDSYQLCADFKTSNQDDSQTDRYSIYKDRWPHQAGQQCLSQKIRDNEGKIPRPVY